MTIDSINSRVGCTVVSAVGKMTVAAQCSDGRENSLDQVVTFPWDGWLLSMDYAAERYLE